MPSLEHSPLGSPYVHGYDQGDSAFPIVAIAKDPRAQGYAVLNDLSAPNGQIINLDITGHKFVGVTPTQQEMRVLWLYYLLPGAENYADTYDDLRGPMQTMTQKVAASGGEASGLTTVANGIFTRAITNAGDGYTSVPSVTISDSGGGTGSGATAFAIMQGGTVLGLAITNPGSGYTTPLVTIGAPPSGGTQATATVAVTPAMVIRTQYLPVEGNRTILTKTVDLFALDGPRHYGYATDEQTGVGTILEAHVVANGTRGGVDYPVARTVTGSTTTGGAGASLSTVTVVLPGTGAVPGATFTPVGGTSSPNPLLAIVTTTAISAAINAAGSGYLETDILTGVGGTSTIQATFSPVTLKVVSGTLGLAGTTLTATGNITLSGGTSTISSVVNVTSLTMAAVTWNNNGTGYLPGDRMRMVGGTFTTAAIVKITGVSLFDLTVASPGTGITTGTALTLRSGNNNYNILTVSATQFVSATVNAPGTLMVAGTTVLTLVGGTHTITATALVTHTKAVSATVAAVGTGDLGNGAGVIVEGTTGTGTKFRASVTITTNAISSVQSISLAGDYTLNPTAIANEPVTYISGASSGTTLTGAQLNVVMGALTVVPQTVGSYTVEPTTANTTGGGNNATLSAVSFGVLTFGIGDYTFTKTPPPTSFTTLGNSPTFSGVIYEIGSWEVESGGVYSAGTATYTTVVLTGSGTGATFSGTFGALAVSLVTAGSFTVTAATLTHTSGLTYNPSYGLLTVAVSNGGSYTANAATMTTQNSGAGTGATLQTLVYGMATVAVTTAGTFTVFPTGFTTSGLGGATLTPSFAGSTTGSTTVEVSSTAGMQVGFDVLFSGTNSVPTLNGPQKVTAIADATHLTVGVALLTATTTGSVQLAAQIHRSVEKVNSAYAVQGSAQLDVNSLAAASFTVPTFVDFPWPNKLLGIEVFADAGGSLSNAVGTTPLPASVHYADGWEYEPATLVRMIAGPEGKALGSLAHTFTYGPPAVTETPFQFFLSSGGILKIGGSINNAITINVDSTGTKELDVLSIGRSVRYSTDVLPHCLTGYASNSGLGQAQLGVPTVAVRLTPSSPTTLFYGQKFPWAVVVSRGQLGLQAKQVLTLTMPSSGGPPQYFQ